MNLGTTALALIIVGATFVSALILIFAISFLRKSEREKSLDALDEIKEQDVRQQVALAKNIALIKTGQICNNVANEKKIKEMKNEEERIKKIKEQKKIDEQIIKNYAYKSVGLADDSNATNKNHIIPVVNGTKPQTITKENSINPKEQEKENKQQIANNQENKKLLSLSTINEEKKKDKNINS